MQNTHRSTRFIGRAALVALLAAPALGAQGRWEGEDRDQRASGDRQRDDRQRDEERRLFVWRGTVENDMRIVVRGRDVETRTTSDVYTTSDGRTGSVGRERRRIGRVDTDNTLPQRDGVVRVQLLEGRGRVYVIQQPNARNDYTAILQVRDAQRGSARYRLAAYFDPTDRRRDDRGTVWSDAGGDVSLGDRVLRWSGSVDGDLRIALRRDQLSYDVVSGQRPQNVRSSVDERLPLRDGRLSVSLRQGRGTVYIAEQPSSFNNYTAVVRVVDQQGGYGHYDFDLLWR